MFSIHSEFISGAVNSIYQAISWSKCDIIAYSCSNQIFLYNPSDSFVFASLPTKAKRVNVVKFIENFETCLLVSGDSNGEIIIWQSFGKITFAESWKPKFSYKAKTEAGIENISILEICKDFTLILTHSINGEVTLFSLVTQELKKIDGLDFGNNVQETSCMMKIDEEHVLMFLGGLDNKLHVYYFTMKEINQKKTYIFHYLASLKGHENAITDLALVKLDEKSAFIASSSKDSYIRIWRFQKKTIENLSLKPNIMAIINKNNYVFTINQEEYQINLESILNLHTEPVSSVKWGKQINSKGFIESNLVLLSSSFDFSLLLWFKDEKSGVWVNKFRLGQMGGNKNAFFGAIFNDSFDKIMAYTYHGGTFLWHRKQEDWLAIPCISGHFSRVTDLDWNSTDDYLISCSQDQTTRVFAKWEGGTNKWHEVSRAQIHGYDINSIKNLRIKSETKKVLMDVIVCGADEKIIRLFEPTAIVANLINKLSRKSLRLFFPSIEEEEQYLVKNQKSSNELEYKTFTEGGAQVLGLMTKAVKAPKEKYTNYYDEEEGEINLLENEKNENQVSLHNFNQPPTEDYLSKHTLWPEINKLYGHGYEIQTITSNHEGNLIASSCKSQTFEHSAIYLWNPDNYSIIDKLCVHNYTVVQLEFSNDDKFLGSVSRDRQFVLFKKSIEDPKKPYVLFFINKSHTRIIWSLSFSHETRLCITGSRDKKLKIWNIEEKNVGYIGGKSFEEGITACAFGDKNIKFSENISNIYMVTVGLESGNIWFLKISLNEGNTNIEVLGKIEEFWRHSMNINRIKFRKCEDDNEFQIASCSDDHSLRIFKVEIKT